MFETEPSLKLDFNEKPILFNDIADGKGSKLTKLYHSRWTQRIDTDDDFGMITERTEGKKKCFSDKIIRRNTIPPTMVSSSYMVDYDTGLNITDEVKKSIGSWPIDYIFRDNPAQYIIGMSVPPLMTARLVDQVTLQWLV